jgi:hypothetical protein
MAHDHDRNPQSLLLELLLEKVRRDPYPSTTMLDMIEDMLDQDHVGRYADALIEKVREENFPSIDHLRRLRALA